MKGEMNCSVGGFDALVGIGVPSVPVVMMSTSEGKLPGANRSLPARASLKNLSIVYAGKIRNAVDPIWVTYSHCCRNFCSAADGERFSVRHR